MFFLHELERVITLPPSRFGPHVEECLRNKLLEDVEGTCTGQYYIVCVMDTYDISEGRVLPSSGVAEYTIHYRAVVWRPFKGETVRFSLPGSDLWRNDDELFTEILPSLSTLQVDAIATSVNAHGVFAEVGPLSVFVSNHVCLFVVLYFMRL